MKAVDFSEDRATANEKYLVGKSTLLSFIFPAQRVPPLRDSKAVIKLMITLEDTWWPLYALKQTFFHSLAMQLVQDVKDYFEPVESIKANVTVEEERMAEMNGKLDDLKQYSQTSTDKLRDAKMLNFQNSDPAVSFKAAKIREQMGASEANNRQVKLLVQSFSARWQKPNFLFSFRPSGIP